MGTIYIDRKDVHIKLDGNAIAFYANGVREGIVPVNPLKRVVVVGNVTIETAVLNKLSQEGVTVVFLSGKRLQFNGMLHGKLHRNGLLRLKQYEKSLTIFALETAASIVAGKIQKQRSFLEEVREGRPDLRLALTTAMQILSGVEEQLSAGQNEEERLRGLEGGAAASYFAAYTKMFPDSLGFEKIFLPMPLNLPLL